MVMVHVCFEEGTASADNWNQMLYTMGPLIAELSGRNRRRESARLKLLGRSKGAFSSPVRLKKKTLQMVFEPGNWAATPCWEGRRAACDAYSDADALRPSVRAKTRT